MLDLIEKLREKFKSEISEIESLPQLEKLKIQYMSRKGDVAVLFERMKDVAPEERPHVGRYLNELKSNINTDIDNLSSMLQKKSTD